MRHLAVLALVFASGCAPDDKAPPLFDVSCKGPDAHCNTPPPGGVVIAQPDGGAGGGGSQTSDAGTRTLAGTVSTLNDATFVARAQYTSGGTIAALGNGSHAVSAAFNGPTFTLPSAPALAPVWTAVTPDITVADVMTTFQAVDGKADSVNVDVARRSVVSDIAALFTTSGTPQSLRSDRAQVVLTFVDASASALPVEGISVVLSSAMIQAGTGVLYDVAGSYSDAVGGSTQSRGTAVIINLPVPAGTVAPEFPGNRTTVIAQRVVATTQQSFAVEVFVAPGAVTFATIDTSKLTAP